ncbi:hypothetical protein ACSBR2_016186 [Camellia fascicularis]
MLHQTWQSRKLMDFWWMIRYLQSKVLQGDSTMSDVKASMTIKANEDGRSWLYESVIIRLNSDFSFNSIRSALKDIGLDQVVARRERQGCNLDFQIPGGAPIKYPEDQGLV